MELLLKDLEDLECTPAGRVSGDEGASGASGCGDDELVSRIEDLSRRLFGDGAEAPPGSADGLGDGVYGVLQEIIEMVGRIDSKVSEKYEQVKALYKDYFGELSSIIASKTDYLEVVRRLLTHESFEDLRLGDILPNSTVMTITISSSTSKRDVPAPERREAILRSIGFASRISEAKSRMRMFLQSRIETIAPNLSALAGPEVAANLLCISGGLRNLAEMPSQNIMVLGSLRNNKRNGHFSTGPVRLELLQSVVSQSDVVRGAEDRLKKKAIRLLSLKCGLCARIDLSSTSKDPSHGLSYRSYILSALDKAREPPQKPIKKPLPVPKDLPKSKRGGKRIRKIKEKFKPTKVKKEMNRVRFGEEEEEFTVDGKTVGLGLLSAGQDGGRRIRGLQIGGLKSSAPASSVRGGGDSKMGNCSSISFTPYQGMMF